MWNVFLEDSMFKFSINRLTKLTLTTLCLSSFVSFSAQAELTKPPRGYHLGNIVAGPGLSKATAKPPKPEAMFRHLIFNFQNPGFHNPATFVATAADQILALQNVPSPDENEAVYKAAKAQVVDQLNGYFMADLDPTDPSKGKVIGKFLKLYAGLFQGFNNAFAAQVGLPKPTFSGPEQLASDVMTESQRTFRMMLLVSRTFSNDFFDELRKGEPVFMLPGDDLTDAATAAKIAAQPVKARPEKATYLVTRYNNIAYGYAYDPASGEYGDDLGGNKWAPIKESRSNPPFTNVIYSRVVESAALIVGQAVKLMDYVVGGYFSGTWDIDGIFMLGTKATKVNDEKAYLHQIVNRVQKLNSSAGELADREASMNKVREVVGWYVVEAMKNKAGSTQVDFARDVSRHAAMGMVSDYFGFYPPDVNSQIQWSRNTQNSFFHNIFDLAWYDHLAMKSGDEMAAYISQSFDPSYREQLKNGRPTADTVSMMIKGHAKIPAPIKALVLNERRIMSNTMGLLVGAGETTTMAVNFALNELMTRGMKDKALWDDFVATAKAAATGDKAAKEKFDAYVWEALRFKPVNPWTERVSDKTETMQACTEPSFKIKADKSLEPVASVCNPVTVNDKSRVLFVTQSAMFDPDMDLIGKSPAKDAWEFSVERGNENYIHFAFGYHRCLGDDVAQAMVPEIILQVVANVNGIDVEKSLATLSATESGMFTPQSVPLNENYWNFATSKGAKLPKVFPADRTPFPETFTIVYDSKEPSVTRDKSSLEWADEYLVNVLRDKLDSSKVDALLEYVNYTQALNDDGASDRVLNNGLNRFDVEKFNANNDLLLDLEQEMISYYMTLNKDGRKELLGMYISESEGANFWLSVLTDLQNRGVQDILIACTDNLKGFSEAILSIYLK